MIVFDKLSLHGRLGNALFQLAATLGIAERRGESAFFNADWIHRPYFSVPDHFFAPRDDLAAALAVGQAVELQATGEVAHIHEQDRIYAQDVNLFLPIINFIRACLAPSAAALEILDGPGCAPFNQLPKPILSVHVRRGDNVPGQDPGVADKQNYYVLPNLDYYQRAIAALRNWFEPASVAVFSDEPAWCERHLGSDVDYVHHGLPRPKEHEAAYATAPVRDWVDLQLMARCQYHVVTGSTFGIWGAILAGDNPTIRCTPVYGPKLRRINEDLLFPSTWSRLELRHG